MPIRKKTKMASLYVCALLLLYSCLQMTPITSKTNKTDEVEFEFLPLLRKYKDGRIERLSGNEFVPAAIDAHTSVLSKDITNIVRGAPSVYARIYLPKLASKKLPLLVYFHGGGFMVQSPASPFYHNYLNALVAESNVIAVSVNYRLAPEYHLPIAYNDSWAVFQWVASHRDGAGPEDLLNRHADFGRLFLSGDSAGGNIAHNMAMNPGPGVQLEILGIALADPYFWGSDTVRSERLNPVVKDSLDKLWPFLTPWIPVDDPRINPVARGGPSLAGLGGRRVLVLVAEKDVLRDRAWFFTQVLSRSGWTGRVEIHETAGEGHVFHLIDPTTHKAKERFKRMVDFFNGNP